LGILSHLCDQLSENLTNQDLAKFKSVGENLLKKSC